MTDEPAESKVLESPVITLELKGNTISLSKTTSSGVGTSLYHIQKPQEVAVLSEIVNLLKHKPVITRHGHVFEGTSVALNFSNGKTLSFRLHSVTGSADRLGEKIGFGTTGEILAFCDSTLEIVQRIIKGLDLPALDKNTKQTAPSVTNMRHRQITVEMAFMRGPGKRMSEVKTPKGLQSKPQ